MGSESVRPVRWTHERRHSVAIHTAAWATRARRARLNASVSVPVILARKERATNLQNELPLVAGRADGRERRVSTVRSPQSGTTGITTRSVATRGARRGRRARRAGPNASVPVTLARQGRATNLQNELPPVAGRADGGERRVSSVRSPQSGTTGITTRSVATSGARRGRHARRAGANGCVPVTFARKGRATNLQNELPPPWRAERTARRRGCHR